MSYPGGNAANASKWSRYPVGRLCLVIPLFCCAASVLAVESVTLLALFEQKALIYIDGERRLMHTGETSPEGLELLSADTDKATVRVNGREEVLQLDMATTFPGAAAEPEPSWTGPESVTVWADQGGSFYVAGLINGYPVRFLVDTGATNVALSSALAERIGIEYTKGRKGFANTAGGVTQMYGLDLDSITIGGISQKNVSAGVVIGDHPISPLLGMSFLGQLDMVRQGNRMELKRRN